MSHVLLKVCISVHTKKVKLVAEHNPKCEHVDLDFAPQKHAPCSYNLEINQGGFNITTAHPNFLGEFQCDQFAALTLLLINSSHLKTDTIDLPGLKLNPCNLCCSNVLQRRFVYLSDLYSLASS